MKINAIKPTTIVGIKTLAKDIQHQQGIQYSAALYSAAKQAGFENFKHAANALASQKIQCKTQYDLYVTVYWHDTKTGAGGRETLRISLSQPWAELILPSQLGKSRGLAHFKRVGPDHIVYYPVLRWDDAQSMARKAICAAARTMTFIDATKLRPTRSYRQAFPSGNTPDGLPGRDHPSVWYDKDTKKFLYVDEPYEASVKARVAERAAWAEKHGFSIAKPLWAGMYGNEIRDGGAKLYLISDTAKGIPLSPVVNALNALPVPITEGTWNGESASFQLDFVSPGSLVLSKPKPAFPAEPYRRKSIHLGYDHFRPEGKMPISGHIEVGGLLRSVSVVTFFRRGAHQKLIQICGELESWTQNEYSHDELANDQFFDLYRQAENQQYLRKLSSAQCDAHVASLLRVKTILGQYYANSVPLRKLFKQIDLVIKSLQGWIK
jgi:hypothetical protein